MSAPTTAPATAPVTNPADLRVEYKLASLDERDVDPDPFHQFARWFDEAAAAKIPEPNAVTLATANRAARPSARIVLLKAVDDRGFTFYTNFESRKADELRADARAALLFFWPELERQVRLEGAIEKVDEAIADTYWASRPRLSPIGAWASPQSVALPNPPALEARFAEVEARFPGHVPAPPPVAACPLSPQAFP